MKASLRFGVLLVLIVGAGILVNAWSYLGEAHVERKDLKDFPQTIDAWQKTGNDQTLDDATLKILRASDYLWRDFRDAEGQVATLYVGYYATQRSGATYHSPLNCLPGSGWVMTDPARITITPKGGGTSFEANRFVIANGRDRALMIYWYQGRGRAVASEYWGKVYTVLDSVRRRRSDGAMVRVMVPMGNSQEEAQKNAVEMASQVSAQLAEFVPN